jgi:hypothetical protein
MTPEDFRRLALSQPEAVEVYRFGLSEFRVERRAFATLGGPADSTAMVKLTPEQQAMFMHAAPGAFVPVPGGWGRLGSTNVMLPLAKEETVEGAQASPFRIARFGFSISFDRNYFCDKVFRHIRLANLKINLWAKTKNIAINSKQPRQNPLLNPTGDHGSRLYWWWQVQSQRSFGLFFCSQSSPISFLPTFKARSSCIEPMQEQGAASEC